MTAPPPLRLEAGREGLQVHAEVVGTWAEEFSAQFLLEIQANGNRAVQRGYASSDCASETVFSRYAARGIAPGEFLARLEVTPSQGPPYQLECLI